MPSRKSDKLKKSLKKSSHLRLVVSNPDSIQVKSTDTHTTAGFSAEVCKKDGQVYQMMAQNPSHYLKCNLTLEIIEKPDDYGIGVICHFPNIVGKSFSEFVEWDETLYGNLMIQFQMNIMDKLLLFCGDYNASGLVIYVDDAQAEQLEVYDHIITHQDQLTFKDIGEKTVIVISVNSQTFDKWVDFMDKTTRKLDQGLRLEQRFNPSIRRYLKSYMTSH